MEEKNCLALNKHVDCFELEKARSSHESKKEQLNSTFVVEDPKIYFRTMVKTFQDISEIETLSKDIPDLDFDIMQKRRKNTASHSVKHFRQMSTTFTLHYNEILRDSTKQQNIALSKDKRNSYPVDFRIEMSSLFRNKTQTSFSEDKEIVDLAQLASSKTSARQGVHIPELIKTGPFSRRPSVNRSSDSDKALNVCGRTSAKKSTSLLPGNNLLEDEGYERRLKVKEDDNVGAKQTIRNMSVNNFHHKQKRENESDFMHQNKNATSTQVYIYKWNEDGENLTSTDSQKQNYEEDLWLKELTQGAHMIENPVSNTSLLTGNNVKNNLWNMDQSNNSNEKECRQAVDESYVLCKKQTDTVHQGGVNVKNPQSSCMLRLQSTKVAESNLEYTQEGNKRSDSSGVILPEMISSPHNIEEYLTKDTEKNDLDHEVKRQDQSLLFDDVKLEYPSTYDYQSTEGIINQQSEYNDINHRINRRRKCSIDMFYGEKIVSMYGEDDKWNKYFAVLEKKNRRKQRKDNVNVRRLNRQMQRTIKRHEGLRGTKKCKKNKNVNTKGTSICLKMECLFPEMANCKNERFDNMEECKGNGSKKGSVKNECEYVGICQSEELHDRSTKWDEGSPRPCTLHRRKTTKTVVRRALQFDRVSEGSTASRKNIQRRKGVFEPSTLCPEKNIPVSNNLNIYQEGADENEVKPSRLGKKRLPLLKESILKNEADQNVSDPYEFKATTPYKKVKLVEKKRKSSEICGRGKFKFLRNGADLGEVSEHKKIVNTSSIGELVEQKMKHMKMEPRARPKDHQGVSSRDNNGFDSPRGTAAFDSGPRKKKKKTIHSSQNGSHSQIGNDHDRDALIFLDAKKEFGYESKYSNLKSYNNSGPRSLQPSSSLSNCHQILPSPTHTPKPFYQYYTEGSNQAKKNNPIIVAATDACQVKPSKASVPVPDLVLQNEMKMSMDSVKMTNWSRQPHIYTQRQEEESFDEDDILFLV